jgi:hypothetical protein
MAPGGHLMMMRHSHKAPHCPPTKLFLHRMHIQEQDMSRQAYAAVKPGMDSYYGCVCLRYHREMSSRRFAIRPIDLDLIGRRGRILPSMHPR